jgi:cell division protein FtsN
MSKVKTPVRDLIVGTVCIAAVLASIACAAVPAGAEEASTELLQLADARSQYREAIWGLWTHRRLPSVAPTVAVASTPLRQDAPERVAVPDLPSIRSVSTRVSTTVDASDVRSATAPVPPTAEISRPAEVRRVLASMGPDAAGRLAAADSGMRLVLQVGSFLDVGNARALALRLSDRYAGVYTSRYDHHGRTFHRVRIARFSDSNELAGVEHALRSNGQTPLRILTPERPDFLSYQR